MSQAQESDMPSIVVTEYTDAACPWAWSAEPMKWRLRWLYGEGLEWRLRMIGLTSERDEYASRGYTPEQMAEGYARFSARYGMPLETTPRRRLGATVPACRAVVAARVHARPETAEALLRRLRIHAMTDPDAVLDEDATIVAAAREAGIDPAVLERWLADPAVERALQQDMAEARDPAPAAVALAHKLAEVPGGGWRYTAPSLVFTRADDGRTLEAPGFQPSLAYEVAVANLDPELPRRAEPESVEEVLAWAGEPLATKEIAEVMGRSLDETRAALSSAAGAMEQPVGTDAFWVLDRAAAADLARAA
jgi:2-hydroxychromene-2-carboxylate isomerase